MAVSAQSRGAGGGRFLAGDLCTGWCAEQDGAAGSTFIALPAAEAAVPATPGEGRAGSIEIALANGARLSVDVFVNDKALSRVVRAMKGPA